ncbi:phosphotransferase family protein [Aspergillus minisclerotigenes]|uniref:Phosphotransferase family protein n=1 Tax=Aspergillus minisclerotigenes TaxID=656917 RepID=A0A5N6J2S0_9EURO|nr:phosphotransferase family protein [Aspergillus minisclerotigenes]
MPIFPRMLRGNRSILSNLSRETFLLPLSSRCYSYQHPQLQMANIVGNPQDFFRYTSGRWIWDERQQLRERYREFDILEVQKIAMELSSSGPCVSMAKIGEGSYNKSFKLTMGNGKTVIARIPNSNAGLAFLTTASEVATMDFLRTILHLPVPKVLAWNSTVDSTNRVGAEYIIMEHAPGKNLADVWTEMDLESKVQTMEDIVTIQHKLLSLKFSEYGCLFYRKDAPPGSHPAISKGRGDIDIYRASAIDYIRAFALREIAWIQKHAIPRSPNNPLFVSHSQNDPAEHISLLQRYLSIAPHLIPQKQDILGSFLWHPDPRTPNIFVDDSGHITNIIDWQSARAGPLFLEGRYPDFLDYNGNLMLELPENFKQLDENTQSAVKDKVTNSILLYLYKNYTKWDLFCRTAKCPIVFSPKEIRKHYEDSEGWNEVQDFWDALSGILSKDSWTSHTTYDQALFIYSQIQAQPAPHSSHDTLPKE